MPYYRYYTDFTDELGMSYRLLIYPSNANNDNASPWLTDLTSYILTELPDEFLSREMKLETELGEIPCGLVSQTLTLTVNIAALQGTAALDSLRTSLLKGTTQKGYAYDTSSFFESGWQYDRFSTFVLLQTNNGSTVPVFIGCQKYSAENELQIQKQSNVVSYKIECFDILRCITESMPNSLYYDYFGAIYNPTNIDFGSGVQESTYVHNEVLVGQGYYLSPDALQSIYAKDKLIDGYELYIDTFDNLRTKINKVLTSYMKSFVWSTGSLISLPVLFARAWTFYRLRYDYASGAGAIITKPAFIAEIWRRRQSNDTWYREQAGGVFYDPTGFAKEGNFYELLKSLIENSLEIYRPVYSWSSISDWFSVSYAADFLRPLTGSGITFNNANVYSDLSFKLFQETVKSAETSCSTLTGEKDSKVFPYSEQGTSGDNGKDLEIIFHNLPSPTGRTEQNENYDRVFRKNSINCGMIIFNDVPGKKLERVDTRCQFKYSNTDAISLEYNEIEEEGAVNVQMIREQQEAGLPYTLSYGLVKALGDARQAEIKFTTLHTLGNYSIVGTNATINLASFNTLLSDLYNSSNATGVIVKHEANIYEGTVEITMRTY
jgi:hypothetical protein